MMRHFKSSVMNNWFYIKDKVLVIWIRKIILDDSKDDIEGTALSVPANCLLDIPITTLRSSVHHYYSFPIWLEVISLYLSTCIPYSRYTAPPYTQTPGHNFPRPSQTWWEANVLGLYLSTGKTFRHMTNICQHFTPFKIGTLIQK